jgi:tetrahydromethanopterin S-methyltransferase subunit A
MKAPRLSHKLKYLEGSYHKYKDWKKDPKGYFLIRLNKINNTIEVGYCKKNNLIDVIIEGKNPQEIYATAIKEKLISKMEHAAYLGKELQKAYTALKYNLEYLQDEELNLVP